MWTVQEQGRQYALEVTDPNDEAGAIAAHEKLIEELAAKVAGRIAPANIPDTRKDQAAPTVTEAVAAYIAAVERRAASGKITPECASNYRLAMRHFSVGFGQRTLGGLNAEEIEDWASEIDSDGEPYWSSSYQHDILGVVISLLRHARVQLDPPIRKPPKESLGADTVLDDSQFAAVLAELEKHTGGDLGQLLRVGRETGARPGELTRLTVEMIDWPNACVILKRHKTKKKTGKDRLIVFTDAAMRVLEAQRAKHKTGHVFRTRWNNPWQSNEINKRLRPIGGRLGFRVVAYGCVRHAFITHALIEGIPEPVVAALVGHSGTKMLANYNHVSSATRTLRDAAEKVSTARTRRENADRLAG